MNERTQRLEARIRRLKEIAEIAETPLSRQLQAVIRDLKMRLVDLFRDRERPEKKSR